MKTNTNIDGKDLGELLKSFYQGQLKDKELQNLKNLKAQDEFLSDAIDGFDEFPEAIENIPLFKPKSSSKNWIPIALFVGVTAAIFLLLKFQNTEIETNVTAELPTQELEEEIIEITKPITNNKKITVPVTKIKQKKNKTTKNSQNTTINEQKVAQKRDFFEIPKMELNPIEIKQKTDYTIKKAKTKALMYYNFLAIDYSVIYTNTISVKQEFGGLDASKANDKAMNPETGDGSTKKIISYKEQLKNSLFQLKNKNYRGAIENFEIILAHFPQDANAEFYIGYSLYYQGNYESAISYFDKAMTNGFDFFFEDAEWFKANSLEQAGQLQKAQSLYEKIKKDGGYYSYQVK